MPDEPSSLEPVLDRRLAALRKSRPDLEAALALQEVLIRTTFTPARPPRTTEFRLPRERALHAILTGVPLLHGQNLDIDLDFAADLFSRLVNALLERQDPELGPRLQELVTAATSGRLDPQRLFGEAFVQHADHLLELAVHAGVDPELLTVLSHQAIAPVLRAYADRVLRIVDNLDDGASTGAAWQRGYCPVCGAWPLLAEVRGSELAACLRCSGCGAAWRWQPRSCPYCAHGDDRTLQMLQVEGERRFRISVCEQCKGYLKVGNAFDPLPAALLALDDLASVHLDVLARERGYRRPGGSGFPIELAIPEAEWLEELA